MRCAIVAMLCGPHDDSSRKDGLSFRRINRAIEVALRNGIPLIIAGDAFEGGDLRVYEDHAYGRGVKECFRVYDHHANTLADVQGIVRLLKGVPGYHGMTLVHLVTDNWHMARAATMLMLEAKKRGLDLQISCDNVYQGVAPPQPVLDGECQGLTDYIEGRYGKRGLALFYGKPPRLTVVEKVDETDLAEDPITV
ncbi:YdcF family protein [Candidatus Uhrbacteria bacterium]|nr:YdcF family protein [Candidatus Uhrbacteria bacterium]